MSPVKRKIIQAARLFDIPPDWMLAIAWVESRLNPTATNPSGAKGLFQFVPSTAREYNIDPFNVAESCAAAAMMVAKNRATLMRNGREATLTAVYLCHQQGANGYLQIEAASRKMGALSPARLANMKNNISPASLIKDHFTDQEKANVFILFWAGRLGWAQVASREVG